MGRAGGAAPLRREEGCGQRGEHWCGAMAGTAPISSSLPATMSALHHRTCARGDCGRPAQDGAAAGRGFHSTQEAAGSLHFPPSCKQGDFHLSGWRQRGNCTD